QVDAKLVAKEVPASLPAGGTQAVKLEGNLFPIGAARGQIVIEADELEKPILVPFEIRTRVYEWIIPLVFLLFGLLGWYVRHRLRDQEVRAELRAQLAPLRKRVAQQIA